MTSYFPRISLLAFVLIPAAFIGCTQPSPPTTAATAPPPPPAPEIPPVEPKPAPPPKKVEPDPYQTAMQDVNNALARYSALFANVRDDASAEKAAEEVNALSARLHKLTETISKIPHRAADDAVTQTMHTQLAALQPGHPQNKELQRVLTDPALAEKFLEPNLQFMLAVGSLAQAELTRRAPALQQPPTPQETAKP